MHIVVCFRQDVRNEQPVACYARSYAEAFQNMGHLVTMVGEGHQLKHLQELRPRSSDISLILEIENGRNAEGQLRFQVPEVDWYPMPTTAVVLVDSHGHPDLHGSIARCYDHVYFAVWARRDLFAKHRSALWLPNASDPKWFNMNEFQAEEVYDFGFFGSKLGLDRANSMIEVCSKRGWTYDVREVVKARRHRWPATAQAMAACRFLYNQGQKHDGPNQRVIESMAMGKALVTDLDELDGMSQLFENGLDFMGYHKGVPGELEDVMGYLYENPPLAQEMGRRAFAKFISEHTIANRASKIMETVHCNP